MFSINKFAEIIETEKSRAPLEKILKVDSFNMESIIDVDPAFFDDTADKATHNTSLVQSVGIEFKGNLHAQVRRDDNPSPSDAFALNISSRILPTNSIARFSFSGSTCS